MRDNYESINYFENPTVYAGMLQGMLLSLMSKVSCAPTYVLHILLNRTRVEDLTEEPKEALFIENFFKLIFAELAEREKKEEDYLNTQVKAIKKAVEQEGFSALVNYLTQEGK